MSEQLSLLVLSCDKYSDLWLDFFKLKDKFWNNCDFKWYLVTETKSFEYPGVTVINTGTNLNWTGRLRYAITKTQSNLIGLFLDDYFISDTIDNDLIHSLVKKMLAENIMHINMSDVFYNLLNMPDKHDYYDEHLFKIPKHKKYGLSCASAIWNSQYLLDIIGTEDKSPWQFEIDLCKKAETRNGFQGLILCDDRMPFNITTVPVVIQGKYYPKAINYFHSKGFDISIGNRAIMSKKEVFTYNIKIYISTYIQSYPRFSKFIKWIAKYVFKIKFFS